MKKTLLIFLLGIICCCNLAAQTTGPTQPEASSFAPIGSDDMVNLYTGDFNYNIPLMVIPGPDGGYPINLFYNSNVGMDQAASWVGLGWNLNAGAIQRNLRGLPDDFKGDEILKTTYMKPSRTISFQYSPKLFKKEFLGLDLAKGLSVGTTFSVYYNNYSGLGINTIVGTSIGLYENKNGDELSLGLGFKLGSQEGLSLSPSLSYDKHIDSKKAQGFNGTKLTSALGFNLNSKQGFSDLNLSFSGANYKKDGQIIKNFRSRQNYSYEQSGSIGSISFASNAPLQAISSRRTSVSTDFSLAIDPKKLNLSKTSEILSLPGNYTSSWIDSKEKATASYGAMYLADKTDEAITDFYRENEGAITKKRVVTPIPILTYDIFSIQGHGVGGSFRAYQNSIGIFSDPKVKSTSTSVGVGLEIGIGTAFKIGGDYEGSIAGSYSGPWKNPDFYLNKLEDFEFNDINTDKPLFEPFYFKMIGETAPMSTDYWDDIQKETPIAFNINRRYNVLNFEAKARAFKDYNRTNKTFLGAEKTERTVRSQHIEYFTKRELQSTYYVAHIVDSISRIIKSIDYTLGQPDHINGISVLKTNGVRYNYFLPAYNHTTKKLTFSVPEQSGNPKVLNWSDARIAMYAKSNNNTGEDEFYSKEVIPGYAHTYFITSILSQDYVDIDNNGPSENDLGTYVKFNYEKVGNYKWRFPYEGAYYSKGYESNPNDDKASYQEGEKDLYYVKAIETKTHIAVFETNNSRLSDADGRSGKRQRQLKQIGLYSKNDPNYQENFYLSSTSGSPKPIQKVLLNQDYLLRKGTPNSQSRGGQYSPALTSLHFSYYNSSNGEHSKYEFKYGNNPMYQDHQQDRWGAYQIDEGNIKVHENPYTYQDESYVRRDVDAAAWLLDEITLPSKGKIEVDYEKDDYAYVQDKKATSYIEMIGISNDANNPNGTHLKNDDLYIFFKSPYPLTSIQDVTAQIKDMEYLRFRVHIQLKNIDNSTLPIQKAKDYVEGYAKIKQGSEGVYNNQIGYIKIESQKPKTASPLINPIRLAALQYLRKSRPDLGPDFGDLSNISPIVFGTRNAIAMLNEASTLIAGYYKTAIVKGWAKEINKDKPSYIRLFSPKQKYGGGSRVKAITMHSNDRNGSIYGQNYFYDLEDGISSGVAEFEPILGIEENVFTQPVWYNADKQEHEIIFANEQSFLEEPMGAGLYPSANVGYSRVLVKNIEKAGITLAQSGINVSEFYTAKDFPTKAKRSGALFAPYWVPVPIPFIGSQDTRNNAYSMGYSFTLNNGIYGSPKLVATYPYTTDATLGEPIQKSVYNYKRNKSKPNELNNLVTALKKEGDSTQVYLGKEVDFYIDEIEASTYSIGLGMQTNLDIQYPAFLPSWFPKINTGRKSTRYLTTTKITYNNPILESISQYKDGAEVKTSNLYYDYETGEPIITSVTNEWNQPVYTYNFPAHWSYDQMKGAYKNYRAEVKLGANPIGSGRYTPKDANSSFSSLNVEDIFQLGDILLESGIKYYVEDIDANSNTIGLRTQNGQNANFNTKDLTIIQSGYKNLQSTKKGKIVSLENLTNVLNTTNTEGISEFMTNYNN